MNQPPDLDPLPEYAHLMTVAEWLKARTTGQFIPYDGDGCWATCNAMARSSDVWTQPQPEWATHVAWFNR